MDSAFLYGLLIMDHYGNDNEMNRNLGDVLFDVNLIAGLSGAGEH
jgi:NTP pyrophosphatase (non-canonical NTP hydrolase)